MPLLCCNAEFSIGGKFANPFPLANMSKHTINFSFENLLLFSFPSFILLCICVKSLGGMLGYFAPFHSRFVPKQGIIGPEKSITGSSTFVCPSCNTSECHGCVHRVVLLIEHGADV